MRVLPADVYDTLEFSALVYRGVGADASIVLRGVGEGNPLCIAGHAQEATGASMILWQDPVGIALKDAGITATINDYAVHAVNRRRGRRDHSTRIPFREWCAELGVVRGDS